MSEPYRETGTVEVFFADRKPHAFGFIRPDSFNGEDCFFSSITLDKSGIAEIKRGDRVTYTPRNVSIGGGRATRRQAWDMKLL
jgi:cold shock CspA family protein